MSDEEFEIETDYVVTLVTSNRGREDEVDPDDLREAVLSLAMPLASEGKVDLLNALVEKVGE